MQPGGRFPTAGGLLDHVFLVERRHLSRLEGGTPPDSTGVPAGDWRRSSSTQTSCGADFRRYLDDLDDLRAARRHDGQPARAAASR